MNSDFDIFRYRIDYEVTQLHLRL